MYITSTLTVNGYNKKSQTLLGHRGRLLTGKFDQFQQVQMSSKSTSERGRESIGVVAGHSSVGAITAPSAALPAGSVSAG